MDLPNYVTKTVLKGKTGIETSTLGSKTDLAGLELYDVGEIRTVPVDLIKLRNLVDTDVVKKTVYDKLVIKVKSIDTKIPSISGLVTKTKYDLDKQGRVKKTDCITKEMPNSSGLVKKVDYCTKVSDI